MADPAVEPIPYARANVTPPRLAPVVWLGIFGLGLIVLGGCFLIGVMICYVGFSFNSSVKPAPAPVTFLIVLYGSATACFAAAIYLLLLAIRGLRRAASV